MIPRRLDDGDDDMPEARLHDGILRSWLAGALGG
jgi:hypothetical protein